MGHNDIKRHWRGMSPLKLESTGKEFIKYMGSAFIRNFRKEKGCIFIDVHDNVKNKALNFVNGNARLRVSIRAPAKPKTKTNPRGVVDIPDNTDFEQFKKEIMKENPLITKANRCTKTLANNITVKT